MIWEFSEFFKKEKENLEKFTLKKHVCPKFSQFFCSKKKKIIEENHHLATVFFFFFLFFFFFPSCDVAQVMIIQEQKQKAKLDILCSFKGVSIAN